jgi:uncharacterized protein YndB with AHSA1/START domain
MNTPRRETDEPVDTDDAVIVECDLPDPPEKVWRALTEPELLAQWLTEDEEDSQDTCEDPEHVRDAVRRAPVECEVIEARPNRLLRYRWQDRDDEAGSVDSIVTFELSRTAGGGTHLRLIHMPVQTATVMRLAA